MLACVKMEEILKSFDSDHKIIKSNEENYEIRTKISNETNYNDSCLTWLRNFSNASCTQWIVAKSYRNVDRLAFRKDFMCQHSAKNKTRKRESNRDRNKSCNAKIIFKIKKTNKFTRYRDPYLKVNLNAVIMINFQHSHLVNIAEAYSFLRISVETREQFIKYFNDGMSRSEAKEFHTASLTATTPTEDLCRVLANGHINPTGRTIYDIYDKWRREHVGDRIQKSIVAKLRDKIPDLEASGFKLCVTEYPFCCVVITPLMLRAHVVQFSSEIVFVNSSGSCDQGGSAITCFFGTSKVGGVPLGCIIHNNQTEQVYKVGFKKFKELLGVDGFYGKRDPMVIMTDDSAVERNALNSIFSNSITMLSTFNVLQAIWRWLWNSSNGIEKNDCRPLMLQFRDILYAKNDVDCEILKKTLCNGALAKKYIKFLDFFNRMWKRRSEWCHSFRCYLHTRGHNTNNLTEVSIRIFNDLVLHRCKAFNAVELVDFVCFTLEQFYKEKLIGFANSRDMKLQVYFSKFCHEYASLNVSRTSEVEYIVTSSVDEIRLYTVNIAIEQCDCPEGVSGKFCKHLCAVYNSDLNLLYTPNLTLQDRIELATLALDNAIDKNLWIMLHTNIAIENNAEENFEDPSMTIPKLENEMDEEDDTPDLALQDRIELATLALGNTIDKDFCIKVDTNIVIENSVEETLKDSIIIPKLENEEDEGQDFSKEDVINENMTHVETQSFEVELQRFRENLNSLYNFADAHPSKHMLKNIVELNHKLECVNNEKSFYNICSVVANTSLDKLKFSQLQ